MREVEPWVGHAAGQADTLQERRGQGRVEEGGINDMSNTGRSKGGRERCDYLVVEEP